METWAANLSADVLPGRYNLEAFGLQMPGRVYRQSQASTTREDFTGHELDVETGLLYAGARYYMPALGRWTSVDPLAALYPNHSPYNYALNNPISFNDPTGNCPEDGSAGPNQYGPGECLAAVVVTARHPDRPTLGQAIGQGFTATLPVAGVVSQADSPIPGPADLIALGVQVLGTAIVAHDIYTNWDQPPNVVLPPPIVFGTEVDGVGIAIPDFDDPTKAPVMPDGTDMEWRGQPGTSPGDASGSYYNPGTKEVLRPDLGYGPPHGPHWDYKDSGGNWWRVGRDGSKVRK
ncbi:MAG: RHS repeat-associated core domain-containing protein [Bacteroidota bacterium]